MDDIYKTPPLRRLVVKDKKLEEYSTRDLLIELFTKFPERQYDKQEKIVKALEKELGVVRTQGAISKGLKRLIGKQFIYKGKPMAIKKTLGRYRLLDEFDYLDDIAFQLIDKKVFTKKIVFYEQSLSLPRTFVFWVKDDQTTRKLVVDKLKMMLNDVALDMFYFEDKLIIMLNYKSPRFQEMSNRLMGFFDR